MKNYNHCNTKCYFKIKDQIAETFCIHVKPHRCYKPLYLRRCVPVPWLFLVSFFYLNIATFDFTARFTEHWNHQPVAEESDIFIK